MIDPATGEPLAGRARYGRYLDVMGIGWQALSEDLARDAGAVALVGNTPKLPRSPGVCLSKGDPDLGDGALTAGPYAQREAEASFRAARRAGIRSVDAYRWFCAFNLCPAVVGNFVTMRDTHHMTPDYSRWLAGRLAVQLGLASRGRG